VRTKQKSLKMELGLDLKGVGCDAKLDTPIEVVAHSIMLARGRSDNDGSILTRLLTVGPTLKSFTTLNEAAWNTLDLPVILRLYIRAFADQAAMQGLPTPTLSRLPSEQPELNYLQKLECDFNMGNIPHLYSDLSFLVQVWR
jgi:hypothetical protein